MRLELELDGVTHWLDFQRKLTRGDTRRWFKALEIEWPVGEDGELRKMEPGEEDELLADKDVRLLAILGEWCSSCYLEDVDGKVYRSLADLTPEALDNLDWAVLDFLFSAPTEIRARRARLGETKGGRSSRTSQGEAARRKNS